MPATAIVCDSFIGELADGIHCADDDYRIALYASMAGLSRDTTVYSPTHECPAERDYKPGGQSLVGRVRGLAGRTVYIDWTTDPIWPNTTLLAVGALVYNASRGNKACSIMDFGGTVTSTNDAFIVVLPPAGKDATIHLTNRS